LVLKLLLPHGSGPAQCQLPTAIIQTDMASNLILILWQLARPPSHT